MLMFSCYLSFQVVRKLKYETHFNFISSDLTDQVFQMHGFCSEWFSFNLILSSNGS